MKSDRPPRPRRSRRRRVSLWAIRGSLVLVLLAGLTALMVLGQTLHAPDWLRSRVEARLDAALGGFQVRFGDVNIIIHKGWRPRLRLQDLSISDPEGRVVAQLADAEASLAMRPLLRGRIQPKRIALSGAYAVMRRDENGALSLSFSDNGAALGGAANLPQLLEQWDGVFLSRPFGALTSVELDAITLNYEDLREGRAWTLDGGHVLITRNEEDLRLSTGFSLLSGRDYVSTIEANYNSTLGQPAASFGISISDLAAEDIAVQSPALAWMEVLRAPISGALRGSIGADGTLQPVSATLQIGEGAVQPNLRTKPVPFTGARTYFTYDPAEQKLEFDEVSINSAWGTAIAEGTAYVDGVAAGALENLVGQFSLTGLSINPAGVYPEPVELKSAGIDFQMKLDPFRLQVGQMNVVHQDRTLRLSGDLTALSEGWELALDAQLDRITPAQLLGHWPEGVAVNPRRWVLENLTEANFSDINLALRLHPGQQPEIFADFDFADSTIRFAKTLPPLVRAQGQASLEGRRFSVTARSGVVVADEGGEIDASGTSFIIPDIGIPKAAPGIARITGSGSVTSMLSLLNRPPLSLMDKANLPVDVSEGQAHVSGTLSLPLKNRVAIGDMRFHFTGGIRDMQSGILVPDEVVSAEQLKVSGDQTGVTVSGEGRFGTVPMQASWHQPIGKAGQSRSELTGRIELSPALMEELDTGLPRGMVTGKGEAELTLGIGGGKPLALVAKSDLEGVRLALPELSWVKPAQRTGTFEMEATLGEGGSINSIVIEGSGLSARGSITFDENDRMRRASFPSFRLGNWISVPLELIGRGRQAPDINVLGGRVDLRNATFGSSSSGGTGQGTAPKVSVRLDRLQVTDSIALTGMQGSFNTSGGLSGNFQGRLNGQAAINGQVLARGGRNAFFLQSQDAGLVFRSAEILTQARGGTFQLSMEPVGDPGFYDARLRVRNTNVKDAPAMAALLNAISLVGLLNEMAGQGIHFTSIESKMRVSPASITILEGSAVGPSIGLSVNGTVNTERRTLDLRGAVSPIYLLNAIGSVLTRKGEGLIGFNYSLQGPMSQPQVFVNPLSGLTPGFLRDLLREPAPKLPAASNDPNAPPPPDPEPQKRVLPEGGGDR